MNQISLIFLGITFLFFFLLSIKQLLGKRLKERFCVLCATISLTWIILLILSYLHFFTNTIFIALLMGHTSLGVFYLIEKRLKDEDKIFRLPLLLTFIAILYVLLGGFVTFSLFIILIVLWMIFLIVYLLRKEGNVGTFAKKIIECCKQW